MKAAMDTAETNAVKAKDTVIDPIEIYTASRVPNTTGVRRIVSVQECGETSKTVESPLWVCRPLHMHSQKPLDDHS